MRRLGKIIAFLLFYGICSLNIFSQNMKLVVNSAWKKGDEKANIKIEVFNDYQCPSCAKFNKKIKELEKNFPNRILIVFHHFPLQTHDKSMITAQAAEAAGIQGKFWEMSDLLFKEQIKWVNSKSIEKSLVRYAKRIGLNTEKFKRDLESEFVINKIQADIKLARELRLGYTPSVFVNGEQLEVQKIFDLEESIKDLINKN